MNSETPLTDEAVRKCHNLPDILTTDGPFRYVHADFARRLELRCKRLEEALRKELENRLELFEDKPHYVHSATCPNYCDYACNGEYGFELASALTDYQEEKP